MPVAPVAQPPNIIIILSDDQGYADVGFQGSQDIRTPNIDRLARNGVICTEGYVSYAVCGPSRAGLLTGRYQDRFGFSRNPLLAPNDPAMGLPLSEETMGNLLKRANYSTAIIGKWHMGSHPTLHPNKRGFDEFYGFLGGGHRYFPQEFDLPDLSGVKAESDDYRTRLMHNTNWVSETDYLTDALSREAVRFVRTRRTNPFFLYLAYNAPHAPLQATEKYLSRYASITDPRRRTYAAMVSAMDDGIGSLLNTLEELKLDDNTLVFFLSDNGGPLADNASNNAPLRGKKSDFFEGGIRVPFAVQWKGKIPAGSHFSRPVISLDLFATAAALAGVKPKNPIDGVNLIPYLTKADTTSPHTYLYWRNFDKMRLAVRSRNEKMITQPGTDFLFHIKTDMEEKQNLAPLDERALSELKSKASQWSNQLSDPLFMGLLEDKEYTRTHPNRWNTIRQD